MKNYLIDVFIFVGGLTLGLYYPTKQPIHQNYSTELYLFMEDDSTMTFCYDTSFYFNDLGVPCSESKTRFHYKTKENK